MLYLQEFINHYPLNDGHIGASRKFDAAAFSELQKCELLKLSVSIEAYFKAFSVTSKREVRSAPLSAQHPNN